MEGIDVKFLWLALIFGWILVGLLAIFGLVIAMKMIQGSIKLDKLISEANGDASLSRFRFLVFTFVIAGGLLLGLLASFKTGNAVAFPPITGELLALLGISGGSYVVSKGIQKSAETTDSRQAVDPNAPKQPVKGGEPGRGDER